MTNNKIVLASITVIVAAGLLALSPSMMIGNAQAEMYDNQYGYDNNYYQEDNNYYQDDNRYSYDKKDTKSSHTDIQKINCGNSNINVNGVDVTEIPHDNTALGAANEGAGTEAANTENGNGLDKIDFNRNLVNVCVNANGNEQARGIAGPQPPDGVTLFTCGVDSNLAQAQAPGQELPVVTDEELCNAATPAEQCPAETDLAGVWVVDADAEGACDVETEAVTVTAIITERTGNTDTSTPLNSVAYCMPGEVVTGGGHYGVPMNTFNLINSHKTTIGGQGWVVNATTSGGSATPSLIASVQCLTNPLS